MPWRASRRQRPLRRPPSPARRRSPPRGTGPGTPRGASPHRAGGADALAALARGGLGVLGAALPRSRAALTRENPPLKRALTAPRLLAGIGNAYSDEILHRARL